MVSGWAGHGTRKGPRAPDAQPHWRVATLLLPPTFFKNYTRVQVLT